MPECSSSTFLSPFFMAKHSGCGVSISHSSCMICIGYVIRGIRYAQICYGSVHEGVDILFVGAVATIQNMVAKQPAVAGLGEWVLPFGSHVRGIIFLDL